MFDIFKSKATICMAIVFLMLAALLTSCNSSSTQHDNGTFLIASDANATGYTRFSLNSGGYALLAWRHWENGIESLRGVYYNPAVGWSDQAVINPDSSIANQVAINENNDCFAVWEAGKSVGTNRYDATSGWGSPSSIPTGGSGYVSGPVVAAGPQGMAFALWMEYEYTSTAKSLWVSSYETGTGWTSAQPIQDLTNIGFGSYTLAVDGSGNAIAVWSQINTLMARRYEAGVGWGQIETFISEDYTYQPQVAFDAAGNALVVWRDMYGSYRRILSRRYSVSSGWEPIETLLEVPVDTDFIDEVNMAMNTGGDAVLVWMRPNTSGGFDIWADRYVAGSGWRKSPVRISNGTNPAAAIDPTGNAVVVWRGYYATRMNIGAARYSPDTGWSEPKIISTDRDNVQTDDAGVAIDAKGNALVVWQEYDLQNRIMTLWGNRLDKF